MEQFIKVSGWVRKSTVSVSKSGRTGLAMKVTGSTIKPREKANFGMLMATLSRASGLMTRRTGTVFILTPMGRSMKGTGKMICSMAMGRKCGQMGRATRETTRRARNMEEDSMCGLMGAPTMASGLTTK